jgi:hypothetical protein
MISKSSIDLEEERQMQIGRRKHKRHIVCLLEFDSTNKHIESTKWGWIGEPSKLAPNNTSLVYNMS